MTYSVKSPSGLFEASVSQDGIDTGFYFRRDGRPFLPAVPGQPYRLRIINRAFARIEVCVSIDGRDVLRDKEGSYSSAGLVIHAGALYDFRGWRVDDDTTREFVFGDPSKSVAAQATGQTSSLGVIGIAAYREKVYLPPPPRPYPPAAFLDQVSYRGSSMSVNSVASAGSQTWTGDSASVGTGIGHAQTDRIGHTRFTRDGSPDILVLGYDTWAQLCMRGIVSADPEAFPGSPEGTTGYEKYRS